MPETYIDRFAEAVYPDAGHLALASFNEEQMLTDATERIIDLESRAEKAEADRDAIAQERDYVRDTWPEHAALVAEVERLRKLVGKWRGVGRYIQEDIRLQRQTVPMGPVRSQGLLEWAEMIEAALRGTESGGKPPADNGGM